MASLKCCPKIHFSGKPLFPNPLLQFSRLALPEQGQREQRIVFHFQGRGIGQYTEKESSMDPLGILWGGGCRKVTHVCHVALVLRSQDLDGKSRGLTLNPLNLVALGKIHNYRTTFTFLVNPLLLFDWNDERTWKVFEREIETEENKHVLISRVSKQPRFVDSGESSCVSALYVLYRVVTN